MNKLIPTTDLENCFNRSNANTERSKELQSQFNAAITDEPNIRRRDLADKLNISEAEIIDAQLGVKSLRLSDDFSKIIHSLPALGYVMTLTRNEAVVHEKKGVYENIKIHNERMGLVISPDKKTDLRLFLDKWKQAFVVHENGRFGDRFSIQIFDVYGTAIQKIFIQDQAGLDELYAFIQSEMAEDQELHKQYQENQPQHKNKSVHPDESINATAVKQDWSNMTDVHQLINILKQHEIGREQILRIVGEESAIRFDPNKLHDLLTELAEQEIPIMCFVGNWGCIQIHTGEIHKIKVLGQWLNILDKEFNLHIDSNKIARAWLVKKPTADGEITSLEFYQDDETLVLQFFGKRIEGKAENNQWRDVANSSIS